MSDAHAEILQKNLKKTTLKVHIAKQNACFNDIWQADLMNFDYKRYRGFFGKFDYISFGDILEHVDNPLNIINNFKSFIKKDGNKVFYL